MRMVGSKVSDYYDSCLIHHDESGNIFIRTPQQIQIYTGYKPTYIKNYSDTQPKFNTDLGFLTENYKPNTIIVELRNEDNNIYYVHFIRVLVAGKLYGGVQIKWIKHTNQYYSIGGAREIYLYSFEDVKDFCTKHKIILSKKKGYRYEINEINETTWIEHFKVIDRQAKSIEHKLVIAVIRPRERHYGFDCELNGELKKVQFYKVMDAFTIYQELATYVDGCLCYPGNAMIEIPDIYKIEGHGFDIKTSFRKSPTKIRK